MERRLAAILAADVVGYTRLMGEDEAGTLVNLKTLRDELVDPKIAAHNGRIVKLMGDGALVEFASVVDAVECAVEIQRAMAARPHETREAIRMELRIGINIGDVIIEGDDIYGDGVNVASRLEGLAEPGGICVSRTVFDHVKGKVDLRFEDLGEQTVKNILKPVRVFRIVLKPSVAKQLAYGPRISKWSWRGPAAAGGFTVLVVAVGISMWQRPWEPREEPASEANLMLPLPEKPSIVVLPFVNLYHDVQENYFVDGFTNAITTHLSKFPQIFVISSTTAFTYKGKSVRVKDIGQDLGVGYVLEGSVQRGANKLSIHAQLIEAESERHVWAEQYDVSPEKLFSVQADVISEIVGALHTALRGEAIEAVLRRPATSLQAYDLYLKAVAVSEELTKDSSGEAIEILKRVIVTDAALLEAHYAISVLYLSRWRFGMADDPDEALRLARRHAETAMAIDRKDYRGHYLLGRLHLFADHDHDLALAAFERALADNPNDANLLYYMGFLRSLMGYGEEAIAWNEKAKRLNPRYPGWYNFNAALAYFWVQKYEKAIVLAKAGIAAYPRTLAPRRILIAILVEMGRMDEAKKEVIDYLKIRPDFRLSTFRNTPFKHQADQDRYFGALRKAGLPE